MVYRHSIVTRLTHGIFGLAFAGLAFTGTQLYLHAHWLRSAGALQGSIRAMREAQP